MYIILQQMNWIKISWIVEFPPDNSTSSLYSETQQITDLFLSIKSLARVSCVFSHYVIAQATPYILLATRVLNYQVETYFEVV